MNLPLHTNARCVGRNSGVLLVATISFGLTTVCFGGPSEPPGKAEAKAGGGPGGVSLPALTARPNFLIGRALFENGKPVPEFEVGYEGGFGGGSSGEGRNGEYAVKNQHPDAIIVRNAQARIRIPFRGKTYVLPLAPVDNKPDDRGSDEWRADIQKGAVRDFIFKLTGTQPGHAVMDPAAVADSDAYDVKHGFRGQTVTVSLDAAVAQVGRTVEITLTPDGPLVDGSEAKTIRRSLHLKQPGGYYYLYDLPLGTYTVNARLTSAAASATPLHVKEHVIEDPFTGGDTPQDSVKITWTFDDHYKSINNPTLSISE